MAKIVDKSCHVTRLKLTMQMPEQHSLVLNDEGNGYRDLEIACAEMSEKRVRSPIP
jgi:hypothetical protein